MKIPLVLLALFMIVSCNENTSKDQDESFAPVSSVDTTVALSTESSDALRRLNNLEDIKKEYNYVLSKLERNSMDSSSFTYNCNGEKKGALVYFSDQTGLRLIQHTYDEYSHFSGRDEYYVKNDSLFFAYTKHVSWSFDTEAQGDNQTVDNVTENRLYFINNKALQCLEKKYTIKSSSSANMQPQTVANSKTDCTSQETVLAKFQLLAKRKSTEKNIKCLEE